MNKLARNLVIFGGVLIVLLVVALYFASEKITQNIEEKINQSLSDAQSQIRNNRGKYSIHDFEFKPFSCSGLLDYTCKSDGISLFVSDPTTRDNVAYENIRLEHIALDLQDIKSKKNLSMNVKTNISYPNIERFFGDSKNDSLTSFLNKSAKALLPNVLECNHHLNLLESSVDSSLDSNVSGDSNLDSNLDSNNSGDSNASNASGDSNISNAESSHLVLDSKCNLSSPMLNTNVTSSNSFTPNINKTHILALLYEIALANGDSGGDSNADSNDDLILTNIPHRLESLSVNLESKKSFKDILEADTTLDPKQKAELKSGFDFNILSLYTLSNMFNPYLGENGARSVNGLLNLISGKSKNFNIDIKAKENAKYRILDELYTSDLISLMSFVNENYDVVVGNTILDSNKNIESKILSHPEGDLQSKSTEGSNTKTLPDSKNNLENGWGSGFRASSEKIQNLDSNNVEQKQVFKYERDVSAFAKPQHDVEKKVDSIESPILRHPEGALQGKATEGSNTKTIPDYKKLENIQNLDSNNVKQKQVLDSNEMLRAYSPQHDEKIQNLDSKKSNKKNKIYFIIGLDNLYTLHTWSEIDRLKNLVEFIVLNRKIESNLENGWGSGVRANNEKIQNLDSKTHIDFAKKNGIKIHLIDFDYNISSSAILADLSGNINLVPEAIQSDVLKTYKDILK